MPEILSLQIGECGNRISSLFWQSISSEHGIVPDGMYKGTDDIQLDKINIFFQEIRSKRYTPRAIFIDLEPCSIDSIRSSEFGDLYRPDNFIFSNCGSGNNWAKGHYTEGVETADRALDVMRQEAENCDCLQGFQLTHSIGGGTGSGMGTLLLSRIRDEYPDRMITTYSVFPSSKTEVTVLSPYNAMLSLEQLIYQSHSTFCLDNQRLFEICESILKLPYKSIQEINRLVSLIMCGITACQRFPGMLNDNLRKLAINMVPYPKLHFLLAGCAPVITSNTYPDQSYNIAEVVQQLFSTRNIMAACNPQCGKCFSTAIIFRGEVSMQKIDDEISDMQTNNYPCFVDWIPDNVKAVNCSVPTYGLPLSGIIISNNTAFQEIIKRLSSQFTYMFKRRKYLQWFFSEGMEESEFIDTYAEILNLVTDYQQYEETNHLHVN